MLRAPQISERLTPVKLNRRHTRGPRDRYHFVNRLLAKHPNRLNRVRYTVDKFTGKLRRYLADALCEDKPHRVGAVSNGLIHTLGRAEPTNLDECGLGHRA